MSQYTFYIDETGDTGLNKIRSGVKERGASPFLVLGGCLIPNSRKKELSVLLSKVKTEVGKDELHCSDLSHIRTAKYARMVRDQARIKLFGFVSHKSTMGDYRKSIEGKGQDQRYYNKCVSYFLERLGNFMLENKIPSECVDIVFEKRDNHDYDKLRNYISKIKRTPLDVRLGFYLAPIDPQRISALGKHDDELLSFADLTAFSVAAAINSSAANFGVPEQRYLRELKKLFFADEETETVGEFGFKVFKRHSVDFDCDTHDFVEKWHTDGVEPDLHKVQLL
ncbi:Protein of unknown function [Pacificibacter marinus]|uniref:DUF3800 domain-containing protein n=2 Tax=Pacificibacter marinus TaxID=658057 RepID=A0A1Y5RBE8_9RHOB|nr:DUF3800 domain-containing protein [Pacificibacter marinus]SEK24947.1 Protein of unknown function [Pacificibacter marinus]SLN13414.1 hypothetical protein PAM7971_00182 [Pacificibacter marinus]